MMWRKTADRMLRLMYEEGATVQELAVSVGVGKTTMYHWLVNAGADFRRRGPRLDQKYVKYAKGLTDWDIEEIRARVASGESQASIARDYMVTRQTICNIARGWTWRVRNE